MREEHVIWPVRRMFRRRLPTRAASAEDWQRRRGRVRSDAAWPAQCTAYLAEESTEATAKRRAPYGRVRVPRTALLADPILLAKFVRELGEYWRRQYPAVVLEAGFKRSTLQILQ